tara:strand:+ start:153 stop:551 length:399 start_codon:yes stop_codon:yes gene_type:complete
MFSREIIHGILLSSGRPELTIYRNEKKHIGYEIRLRVNLRADNLEFLDYIKLALTELNITSKIKESESKIRPKPILWVSGVVNVVRVCDLIGDLPSSKDQWATFKEAAQMIYRGEHTTQNGFDELLKLKGEI